MNPRRLVDLEPQGIRSQLLRAGMAMQPPDSTYKKTLLGLGVAGTSLGTAKGVGAAVGATGPKAFIGGTLFKWVAIGCVGGSALLGAAEISGTWPRRAATEVVMVHSPKAPLRRARTSKQSRVGAAASAEPAPGADGALGSNDFAGNEPVANDSARGARATPALPATSAESLRAMARSATSIASAVHPSSLAPSALAAEVSLVDEIRRAVEAAEPARALELIGLHGRRFGDPHLSEEVAFFRARALAMSGRLLEAQRAMEQFESDYPASPLTERH
ncbi:MAG TPA: hypothetical protein VIV60_19205 [Polyangiaceae bacterium]